MHAIGLRKVSACAASAIVKVKVTYNLQLEDIVDLHRSLVALQNVGHVLVEELESILWNLCAATGHIGSNAVHQPYQD